MNIFKEIIYFFCNDKQSGLTKIENKDAYLNLFIGNQPEANSIIGKAYEKAWDARKFEIDNYWKRATYFWAFQVASFTAYFALLNSSSYNSIPQKNKEVLFGVIAIGLITSLAWVLINNGSKFWQRHWEKHIDMLEDKITGPLYKTVYAYKTTKTFSVSKINDIISRFFVFIWIIFAVKYFSNHLTFSGAIRNIAWIEVLITFGVIYFVGAMFKGHGRGNFGTTPFEFYNREVFDQRDKQQQS